jgi:hypothetical protein
LPVPRCLTDRLESNGSVIEKPEAVLPITVDDEIINGMHDEALLTGRSPRNIRPTS